MAVIGSGMEAVRSFARRCLDAGGIPIFKTRFGGKRFENNAVIAACWGKGDVVKGGKITNVPTDVIEKMEKTRGDYKWILGGA
jgi:hypothetical protein